MIEFLESIDRSLLLLINGWNSPFFDNIMWFISGKTSWIPLYLVLLYFVIRKEKKKWWLTFIFIGIAITLADQISVNLFKNVFERYRPSHNLELKGMLHHIHNYYGGSFGFVSSHATNTFAIASLLSFIYQNKKTSIALFAWAAIVSYSRVYLGVHYPADVVCGATLGMAIGFATYKIYFQLKQIIIKKQLHQ